MNALKIKLYPVIKYQQLFFVIVANTLDTVNIADENAVCKMRTVAVRFKYNLSYLNLYLWYNVMVMEKRETSGGTSYGVTCMEVGVKYDRIEFDN